MQTLGTASSPGGENDDSFIELIEDTLQEIDPAVQGAFLQKFVKCLASVEVSEANSLAHWQQILRRRKELTSVLNRPVALRIAAIDHFSSAGLLKNPMLLEYGEFKRLRHSAATDPLTGFYNRRLFEDYLARELNRASRYKAPFALILIDLRDFKGVNDTYGHSVGDAVLRAVTRACVETIRGSDYPFRIGGDEFAILLPESETRSAEFLARRIAQKFEHYAQAIAPDAKVGMDYGVGSFPTDGASASSLFEAADRNLYLNKRKAYERAGGPVPDAGESAKGVERAAAPEEMASAPLEKDVSKPPASVPAQEGETPAEGALKASTNASARRHHPRFSLQGSWSLGVIEIGSFTELVRILDISSGGVGLLVDGSVEVPEKFQARLNVPVFAPGGLALRRMYACPFDGGKQRVGCTFDA